MGRSVQRSRHTAATPRGGHPSLPGSPGAKLGGLFHAPIVLTSGFLTSTLLQPADRE